MKVAIVLLLVAVSACSAAFTGSLVQQTRPAFNRASLQASVASSVLSRGDKDIGGFLQGLVDSAVAQAEALIAQISGHVSNLSTALKAKIRAAIAALQTVASAVSGAIRDKIESLIATLQGFLAGSSSESENNARLVAQLNLPALLQNALQNTLTQLVNNQFVQNLISQLKPFLDQAGNIIQQVTDLILGNTKLSPAAPRGLFDQVQSIIATVQGILAAAVESAQAAAQQLIQQALAQGQATVQAAAAHAIGVVNSVSNFLPPALLQPLIDALTALAN